MASLMPTEKRSNHDLFETIKKCTRFWVTSPDPESVSSLGVMDAVKTLLSMDMVGRRNLTQAKSLLDSAANQPKPYFTREFMDKCSKMTRMSGNYILKWFRLF